MVAFQPPNMGAVPLPDIVGKPRLVPPDIDIVRTARAMGISFGD